MHFWKQRQGICKSLFIICTVFSLISGCAANHTSVEKEEIGNAQTDAAADVPHLLTEYEKTLQYLENLEQLCIQYAKEQEKPVDAFWLMTVYIRCQQYQDAYWNAMAGTLPKEFIDFLEKQSCADLSELQSQVSLELPNGETCDFLHLFATMNMLTYGYGPVGGWGGDLVQLTKELMQLQNTGTEENLYKLAVKRLGAEDSSFNLWDLYADMDAVNLYERKMQTELPMWKVMEEYYREVTQVRRVEEFLNHEFETVAESKEDLRTLFYERAWNSVWMKLLCKAEHIEGVESEPYKKAVAYALADWCFTSIV